MHYWAGPQSQQLAFDPVGPLMGHVTGVSELGEHLPSGFCPTLVRTAPPAVIPPPFLANVEQLPRQEGGESRRGEMPSASTWAELTETCAEQGLGEWLD